MATAVGCSTGRKLLMYGYISSKENDMELEQAVDVGILGMIVF